jgi:HD-like signal output (HDOD) protein
MENRPGEFEGRLAAGKDWREIVAWVGDLPPMPQVASQAISMVEDPDTTAQNLTDILSKDAALAARVLKISNSAMFSRQREIKTLNQAVMVIGFKALKGIIVAATLRQLNKRFGKTEQLVWENSMVTAMCATQIARELKKRYVEEIFLLGLLHNLGQIVFLAQSDTAPQFKEVLQHINAKDVDYATAESAIYGFAHPLIGALVSKKWNFSAETCQVILHYTDPLDGEKATTEQEEKTAIVQLAELIAHASQIGSPEGYPDPTEKITRAAKYLGVEDDIPAFVDKLITQTKEQFENEGSIYG